MFVVDANSCILLWTYINLSEDLSNLSQHHGIWVGFIPPYCYVVLQNVWWGDVFIFSNSVLLVFSN